MTGYAACVIPWIVLAVVVVPLVIAGFVATRRSTVAREHPVSEDAQARARTEREFAEAEAYEEKWREKDKEGTAKSAFPNRVASASITAPATSGLELQQLPAGTGRSSDPPASAGSRAVQIHLSNIFL